MRKIRHGGHEILCLAMKEGEREPFIRGILNPFLFDHYPHLVLDPQRKSYSLNGILCVAAAVYKDQCTLNWMPAHRQSQQWAGDQFSECWSLCTADPVLIFSFALFFFLRVHSIKCGNETMVLSSAYARQKIYFLLNILLNKKYFIRLILSLVSTRRKLPCLLVIKCRIEFRPC